MLFGGGVICGDLLGQLQPVSSVPVVCLPHSTLLHVSVVCAHMGTNGHVCIPGPEEGGVSCSITRHLIV